MQTRLVDYHDLSAPQRQQLGHLEVTQEQTQFSGDIYTALNTLLVNPNPNVCGFVLLGDDRPVGFFLLKRGDCLPHWAQEDGSATLHALQIDHREQGKGLGKACLQSLPAALRLKWPDINQLMLSVDADNSAAIGLYAGQGWIDTGEAYRGRIGFERRLALKL
ncbi:GNAT family N-acetyltransferase [Pseudomonas syringae pv. tagetis]|uniref:Acetyltransferase n=3 Tax=Pseudomonas syringae group TaxID=136849 RepID=A0A0P9KAR8_9PSED|nr:MULTISPECIES: GNAT family N-acetyltransferase [Pseudomonas syringae group]KAA8693404.1 GNAT family N-acetyltransferase [Pseudomonas caricapapayae]KPW61748.1 Acetyltransferase [Pseudomonas caricapapayae]KPX47422.1 Acetyltransferase [Pseudomonas syringae pv. helianthi]KPY84846.1 Acetyltransferase [Pseudomonas syringae pv. tagetis]RMM14171.1 Acetyltransferase [Pseudomonas caricapapayae]